MDKEPVNTQETVYYETEQPFLLHINFSTDSYPSHWHNAVEIVMPIQNAYQVDVNHWPYHLNEYDILIIPSGGLHIMRAPETKGQRVILQFDLELLNSIRGFINASYLYTNPWLITPGNDPDVHEAIKTLLMEMLDEQLRRDAYYDIAITNRIIGITLHLARKYPKKADLQYTNLVKRKEHMGRLNECLNFIYQNYADDLTLEMAAQAVSYSKYYFSRWFREFTNMSFYDFLTKVRIDKAETLLLNTARSVTEIALEAGFQSTATFNRVFKNLNHCTPKEYRYTRQANKQAVHIDAGEETAAANGTIFSIKTPAPAGAFSCSAISLTSRLDSDGAFSNPFLWADVPDPDVIRVGDIYYMTSTTMYFCPGIPVMKSYDLVHWEIVNYVYDILDDSDACALRNGAAAYGKGSWASSLRHHNGVFFVVAASFTTNKTYIFQTENIENGSWRRYELDKVFHDPSLLFDDDGRVYLAHGGGAIRVVELNSGATAVLSGGLNRIIIEKANAGGDGGLPAEGSHIYKVNGKYYLFLIAWPPTGSGRRIELCYRADCIAGPYEGRVVLDDDMGYKRMGVAQGGIIDTPNGDWFAVLFQDYGAVGRVPVLTPVIWVDDWPVFGTEGAVPLQMKLPPSRRMEGSIVTSDEFSQNAVYKDYGAYNDIGYRYEHIPGNGAANDSLPESAELLLNNRFKDGIAYWDAMEVAKIEIAEKETYEGLPVLSVTTRITTASGLRQFITGKVKPGGIYKTSAKVKYMSGPPEKTFNLCIRNGTSWEEIQIIGSGNLTKGEWGCLNGTYTLPEDADLSETSVFIETPYSERPKKEKDLMDYYVAEVSITEKHLPRNTKTMPGENDPAGYSLPLQWQWNHNPDHNLWSLTERPGYLRLHSGYLNRGFLDARNTLTQRTFGPVCAGTTAIDVSGMNDGDAAGLAALQELYGYVGVKMVHGKKYLVMVNAASGAAKEIESVPLRQNRLYLRADFDFDGADNARFYFSLDELTWRSIGDSLPMQYKLSHFTGYRFALFYYSTQLAGGYTDFDYFRISGELAKDNESLTILSASFGGDTAAVGLKNTQIDVSIHMEALPEGDYKGLYVSVPVPALFDVADVVFCSENICGETAFTVEGKRLRITVTGEAVSFSNHTSDLLAVLRFKLNDYAPAGATIDLQADYIYADGGNAAYLTHNMRGQIVIRAIETGAAAKLPGYANPLVSHKFGADPWALEYDGRLYLYLTGDTSEYNEYGRLIENTYHKINTINVISSADLLNWTDHGAIPAAGANGAAKWAEYSWAPSVAYKKTDEKDRFFLYFSNEASNIGVLTADSPLGPWTDPLGEPLIHLGLPGTEGVPWCFDPAVLIDDDGSGYLYFGGGLPAGSDEDVLHPRSARVIRLGGDMVSTVGEAVTIDAPAFYVDSGIHKYAGRYYYSYCSNFEGSHPHGYPSRGEIAYMVSDHPLGPFTYKGIILKNPSAFFGEGDDNHHCVFTFKGQWYIAYQSQTLGKAMGRVKGYRSPHINRLSYYGNGQIRQVRADMKGASLPGTINPYERADAVTFAWCAGISVNTGAVTHIHDGDWLAVANVDFGKSGASRFHAWVASRIGGEIELRLDSPVGDTIGSLGVGVTGDDSIWAVRSCDVKPVVGVRNVFFMFRGDSDENLFSFRYWVFG
ncbi:MAG: family 43 glycosylhydrolase [Oscillospiraceae bacterium]|nr:family 43 glycosylhydrolase [Oscillospiraceae bacterium]